MVYYITGSRGIASMWLFFCDIFETDLRLGINWDTLLSSLAATSSNVENLYLYFLSVSMVGKKQNNPSQNKKTLKSPENKHLASSFKVMHIKI